MASARDYLDFVLEQLSALEGVSARSMMGEYVLYCQGRVIGGVYDDRFLVKAAGSALRLMREAGLEPQTEIPYPGAKEMLLADVDRRELLCGIVRALAEELPLPKSRARRSGDGRLP